MLDARIEALVNSLDMEQYALECQPKWFQNHFCNKMRIKEKMIKESGVLCNSHTHTHARSLVSEPFRISEEDSYF